MYNIAFTSIPIMFFALFDFAYDKEVFLTRPSLYVIGLKNVCFNTKIFWEWVCYGAFQALLIILFCYYPVENTLRSDGTAPSDVWGTGSIVYAAVVILANFRLLNSFNNYTGWGELLCMLSIMAYFLLYYIESFFSEFPQLYQMFVPVMTFPLTLLGLFLTLMMIFTIDPIFEYVRKYLAFDKIAALEEEKK